MPIDQEVRHSRQLQMMGQLSEVVAHDMNNLLSGVLGYSELLLEESLPDSLIPLVEEIMKAGKRLASLTHLLLIFREHEYRPEIFNVNEMIMELEKFIARVLRPQVRFSTSLQPGVLPVNADLSHIKRALLSLAFEMRDAMPDGGQITFSTDRLVLPNGSGQKDKLAPGDYVRITVQSSAQMPMTILKSIAAPGLSNGHPAAREMNGIETIEACGGHLFQCGEAGLPTAIEIVLPAV